MANEDTKPTTNPEPRNVDGTPPRTKHPRETPGYYDAIAQKEIAASTPIPDPKTAEERFAKRGPNAPDGM